MVCGGLHYYFLTFLDGILKFWCREPPGSMLKNEPRHDWQDASLALKITYGPSKNSTAHEKVEEKVTVSERKSTAPDRGNKQSEPMRPTPSSNPVLNGSHSRDGRGEVGGKSRDDFDREENLRKKTRFS